MRSAARSATMIVGVRVAARDHRHHRRVGHPQPADSADAQFRVDDGLVVDADPAGPHRVVEELHALAHVRLELRVADRLRPGIDLPPRRGLQRLAARDAPRELDSGDHRGQVVGLGQAVGEDARPGARVRGGELHPAATLRAHQTGPVVYACLSRVSAPCREKNAGAKWNCRSAAGRPCRERTNANASATELVSGPDLRRRYSARYLGCSASSSDPPAVDSKMQTT